MSNKFEVFHLYAETSIHAGTGSDIGIVDLPIQRERHTEYPVIWSSSLKGAVRSYAKDAGRKDTDALFGPWKVENIEDVKAGKISVSDAKILAFPVRSTKVPFVWVTSPIVLNKYIKILDMADKNASLPLFKGDSEEALVANANVTVQNNGKKKIFLEEFGFDATVSQELGLVSEFLSNHVFPQGQVYDYFRKMLKNNLVMVKDDIFTFITKNFTEVNPRIRIDPDTGTVREGALWYEENLPEDTIMYFTLSYPSTEEDVNEFVGFLDGKRFSVGGNKTIGKGIVSVRRYK